MPDLEDKMRASAEYYAATVEVVMVPVTVRYHDATGVVYGFDAPKAEDVEKSLTSGLKETVLQRVKEGLNETHREVKKLMSDRVDREALDLGVDQCYSRLHILGRLLGMWE